MRKSGLTECLREANENLYSIAKRTEIKLYVSPEMSGANRIQTGLKND